MVKTIEQLKARWVTFYKPLQSDYFDLFDSMQGCIEITMAALIALKNTSTMQPGIYKITDSTCADNGIFIRAFDNARLSDDAYGVYILPDFQNVNGNNVGVWTSGLTGLVANTSICIWNNKQWKSLTGVAGTAPDGDAVNWVLTFNTITETMRIKYDLTTDTRILTICKRNNRIINSPQTFQWGNDNVMDNSDSFGTSFSIQNQRGQFWGSKLNGGGTLGLDNTHQGLICAMNLTTTGYVIANLILYAYNYVSNFNFRSDYTFDPAMSFNSYNITDKESDYSQAAYLYLSTTDFSFYNDLMGEVVFIPGEDATMNIETFSNFRDGRRVRFRVTDALSVSFIHGGGIHMKDATSQTISGPEGWIELEKINGVIKEYNRSNS